MEFEYICLEVIKFKCEWIRILQIEGNIYTVFKEKCYSSSFLSTFKCTKKNVEEKNEKIWLKGNFLYHSSLLFSI